MKKNYFVFISALYISINAQDVQAYSTIYSKAYLEIAPKDFNKAIQIADSLYSISETPYFQTKSLMLTAALYQQFGDIDKSIEFAIKSEKIIENTDDNAWKAKVYGFLATQYRIVKLYEQSRKYALKVIEISERIDNLEYRNNVKGLVMQEMAYYEMEQQRYRQSIRYIHKSQEYFNLTRQDLNFFSSNNEQLLGLNYYYLKNFNRALFHYSKAIGFCKNVPDNHITGLIYNGFAQVYIEKNDLPTAKKYIDLAQSISDKSEYLQLKQAVFSTIQKYYTLTKDINNLTSVQQKQDSVVDKIQTKSHEFINKSYSQLEEKNTENSKKNSVKNIIIWACFIFMISGSAGFVMYMKSKQKKTVKRFKEIMEKLNAKKEKDAETAMIDIVQDADIEETDIERSFESEFRGIMTIATENKILRKLEKFEKSNLYTNNNISLSTLSSSFGTNTKYLSHIINTHKKKDFNNYINDLRVYYVIEKLKYNTIYRKYKIAVLAKEAGFSSQNKFATVFKKTTSMSPSLFIKHLEGQVLENK